MDYAFHWASVPQDWGSRDGLAGSKYCFSGGINLPPSSGLEWRNNLVFENKLDFAISCIPEFHKDLTKVFLYNDPFCVAFYKGHHFQNMKEVPIDEIRKEPNYIFRRTCEFFYYNYKLAHKGKLDYKIINNIIPLQIMNDL